MRDFWDARAQEDPYYYVDNRLAYAEPDLEAFWRGGDEVLDGVHARLGVESGSGQEVVEIGCGVGRLTRALAGRAAERAGPRRLRADARRGPRPERRARERRMDPRRRRQPRADRRRERRRRATPTSSSSTSRTRDHARLRARDRPRAAPRRLGRVPDLQRPGGAPARSLRERARSAAGAPRSGAARGARATPPGSARRSTSTGFGDGRRRGRAWRSSGSTAPAPSTAWCSLRRR